LVAVRLLATLFSALLDAEINQQYSRPNLRKYDDFMIAVMLQTRKVYLVGRRAAHFKLELGSESFEVRIQAFALMLLFFNLIVM
jgi:hypothetical protein